MVNRRKEERTSIHFRMAPDWRGENPYQRLLAEGIEAGGGRVDFLGNYRRGLPLSRGLLGGGGDRPHGLHLHWLPPYARYGDFARRTVYAAKLALDLTILRRAGIGIVWTVHNTASHEARHPRLEEWLHRLVAARSDRILLHSTGAAEEAKPFLGGVAGRVRVIPHGHYRGVYPAPPPRVEARRRLGFSPQGRVFLFIGLLREYKGIEELIDAWKTGVARARGEAARLVIAGRAIFPAYAEELRARIGDTPGIDFRPRFVPDDELTTYLSAADAVVLPFRRILTSGSLLLAMSYGCPVIAPRLPFVTELLGNADDLTYDPDAADGLARALERARRGDPTSLAARTSRRVDAFGWDGIGRRTLAVYEAAAAAGRARRGRRG